MAATTKRALTLIESDLAVSFYDTACDHPSEVFEQIVSRVLGMCGFALIPHPEKFHRECERIFNLAHGK
jgi:hypothetical protein